MNDEQKVSDNKEFKLKISTTLIIPDDFVYQKCYRRNKKEFNNTPMLIRLEEHDNGNFSFLTKQCNRRKSFVMFAPAGLEPGDVIIVVWVDPNCACATLISYFR